MRTAVRAGGLAPPVIDEEEIVLPCDSESVLRLVEAALERRYQNIFSSVAHLRAVGRMRGAQALVVRKGGEIDSAFLFRIENEEAVVMNEAIQVNDCDVQRVADHIFSNYSQVAVISWHAIQVSLGRCAYPFQRVNYSEDIVIALPPTEQKYLARLGKATRKNLLRHKNRFERDHPSLEYTVCAGADIKEWHIRQIVDFNRARMAAKNKECGLHEADVARLVRLAATHGLLIVIAVEGRICAGSICLRVGDNYFMEISAHDPVYDGYRLGTLCCYFTICEAIARGGRELHLLWGRDEYKFMLLGVQRDLDDVLVHRSRTHMLLNGGKVLHAAARGVARRAKLGLDAGVARDAAPARLVKKIIDRLRVVCGPRPHRM